jgi:phosphatidylserine decarboxylase
MSGPRWRPLTEGWPMMVPLAALGLLVSRFSPRFATIPWATAGAIALTLRDPERTAGRDPNLALSPADGTILHLDRVRDDYFEASMLEIGIFLALWDVHVQRWPLDGTVVRQHRHTGKFRPAFTRAATTHNTQLATYLQTASGPCVVTQISGLVARRIVCWATEGERVAQGDRLGLIKLGSQVTLRLPETAAPLVRVGEHVTGGITPVARLVTAMSRSTAG